jgi:hypothetical protein
MAKGKEVSRSHGGVVKIDAQAARGLVVERGLGDNSGHGYEQRPRAI